MNNLNENDGSFNLANLGITNFRTLFNKMPSELQRRVYNLKNIQQRPDKHPEGNVLKHTITVVNRSIKDDDIDIAIAAMFHDIGKDETEAIHPIKGHITHYGHEKVSASLVSKYKDWIKSVGGNPANVYYIVKNHMKYKQLSNLRTHNQHKLKSFRAYDKLSKFSRNDRGGLSESKNLKLKLPNDILKIHKAFKKNGKKLYVVGGAVRDAILGSTPKDFDLATDAKPDEVIAIANSEGMKTVEVGKSFGVVIVDGNEIATFRRDLGKGRRPDAVEYTDIAGDVRRRDLTVNALFYDIDRSAVVDLVGGISDLKKKRIRAVGDATIRFDEDPLRKLRALRFQTKLGGVLDYDLFNAIKKNPTLNGVSAERIRDEFLKSIKTSKDSKKYMELLDSTGLSLYILPGLKFKKPYVNTNDYILFLSHLLMDNGSGLDKRLNALKYTKDDINNIRFLISLKDFTSDLVANYKRNQNKTTLSDSQIVEFGKLIGKNMNRFVNFKLTVRGNEVPSHIRGAGVSDWINKKEADNYINQA